MWVLVFGLAFGVLCSHMAAKRGRSGFAWAILGFLFSLIALVFLLALGDSDEIAKCPKCYGKVDYRAFVCMHCRHQLRAPLNDEPSDHVA